MPRNDTRACRGSAWLLLLVCLVLWPGAAAARDARVRASSLLREGNTLHDQGRYREALALYREAYDLFPSYKLHYNFALTLNAMGHHPEAAESMEQFLARAGAGTPDTILQRANTLRAELWRVLGAVKISCPVKGALVKLDGRPRGTTPLSHRIYARPGRHRLTVEKPGQGTYSRTLDFSAGRGAGLEVRLGRAGTEGAAETGWGRRAWTWTAAGAGGALLLTSVILYGVGGGKGSSAHARYQESTTAEEFKRNREAVLDARDMLTAGHVLLGAALVAGGAALYLHLAHGPEDAPRVGISPGPRGGGLSVAVPF